MKVVLGVFLGCLVLVLPSAALPRKGSTGERSSPINRLELSVSEELGLEAEERKGENTSLQERARPSSVVRSRMTRGTHLFSKPDPGAKCLQGMAEGGDIGWSRHPWPLGGLEGPVCRVKMEQDGLTPKHLDVVGVLTHYESNFIKLLRQRTNWDENYLETFGLCPAGEVGAALHPLKHIHAHVLEPGQDRFLVLHLEEVQWGAQSRLWFKLVFQAELGRALGELRSALLLFYPG
ncbi:muellerian-inhibiting factor, partial [Antrostomus carolinensis]|uniref:muellerian-inhibiting factor n=1 Tax=Antrostomus carolinensis TaxID=279965 RepID=UPI0005291CA8